MTFASQEGENGHTETRDLGSDGNRDDKNDSAWTTPIWFSIRPPYVWSKNSHLYHDRDCWAVLQIGTVNRREGSSPPNGMIRHNCRPPRG